MTPVICDMSVSLDGYVTGPDDNRQNPFGDGGWGNGGPAGDIPCFVVTRNKPATSHPPVYTFVTDGVVSAIEQAKNAPGGKAVTLHGVTLHGATVEQLSQETAARPDSGLAINPSERCRCPRGRPPLTRSPHGDPLADAGLAPTTRTGAHNAGTSRTVAL